MTSEARTRHVEQRSELERTAAGKLVFRSNCSCGWQSQQVRADQVVELWDQHVRAVRSARGGASQIDGDGVDPALGAASSPLRTKLSAAGEGASTLAVSGELDLFNARQLEGLLVGGLRGGDIDLDLRLVTFADSTGLNALVAAKAAAAAHGRRLHITPSPIVRRLIEVRGVSDQLLS